jgi:rhodanese-related sulfurtransferase
VGELDPAAPTVVFCAGGYRSAIASSLLRSLGFTDVSDLVGGFGAWSNHQKAAGERSGALS